MSAGDLRGAVGLLLEQRALRTELVERLGHARARLGVGQIGHVVHIQLAVALQPAPHGAGGHGDVLVLRVRQPRLNLGVGGVLVGEELLPVAAALVHAPDEQLAAEQPVGGKLNQAARAVLEGGDILAVVLRNIIEEIDGVAQIDREAAVDALVHGHGHAGDVQAALEIVRHDRAVGRHDDAGALALIDGDVAPPVHGGYAVVGRVLDGHLHEQNFRLRRQIRLYAIGHAAQALKFKEAHAGSTVVEMQ